MRMIDVLVLDEREAQTFSGEKRKIFSHPERKRSLERIDNLDLTKPLWATQRSVEDDGEGWTPEQAKEAERWYKMFLKLYVLCPDANIVPPKHADRLWHAHILHTVQYHIDCNNVFGKYLHHYPYDKDNVKQETMEELRGKVDRTASLFFEHFGEAPDVFHWFCWNNCSVT